jgi:N-acyl-D-amino-acid deacylase
MARFDLAIVGGTVVDGTGLPRRRADVGIKDGRIAVTGFLDASDADQVIDADGHCVAPGIVDVHTHYDPQLTFEPYATSSCFHGVTTVVAGNCGFSIAPTKAADREFITQMFARVEGMSPKALAGVRWDFETFPEFLACLDGRLGVNMSCYVGHSAVRRWVMGDDCYQREATDDEIARMEALVTEAMAAGAAGFSSSHAPTHWDSHDRPVPSRLASMQELETLAAAAGRANAGTIAWLPFSSIGGLDGDDQQELIRLSLLARMPVVIQGLGARSKIDAPTASWDEAKKFVDEATARGASVHSMVMAKPFNRTFTLAAGTTLYEGVPAFDRMFKEARTVPERIALLRDPVYRESARWAVEHPNRDATLGPTLPPPNWAVLLVNAVTRPEHAGLVGRSVADLAAERGVAPADCMLDLALSEDLAVEWMWSTETEAWRIGTRAAASDPHMVLGVSDGGAHLDRDDGSEWSSWFFDRWVRRWGAWTIEDAVRLMTQIPASLCGFSDRGQLRPGFAADVMIFDPDTLAPDRKEFVHDFPNGEGRWRSQPKGLLATIVNGVPIVFRGATTGALPGQVVRPTAAAFSGASVG